MSAPAARTPLTLRVLLKSGWAPLSVFTVHVLASHPLDIYRRFPRFDVLMHVAGGIAIAFFFACAAREAARDGLIGAPNAIGRALHVFGLVCSATVFWEFAEFVSDRWFGSRAQGGLQDTLGDMLFGILGGLAYLVAAWRLRRSA